MEDITVFDDKTLADILRDIHDNTLSKRQSINSVIAQLAGMMTTADEAQMMIPLIKDFYEVGIKNDEHMVKVATIAQRIVTSESSGKSDMGLTEEEKEELLKLNDDSISELKIVPSTKEDVNVTKTA